MENVTQINNNFAKQNPYVASLGIDEPSWNAICESIFPGANHNSVVMAINYCRARGLDVMLKPVHLVPMKVKDSRTGEMVWRDAVMPGIGSYRIQADRSGNYAGANEPEFGPIATLQGKDKYGKEYSVKYPEWCKYTVYKTVGNERVAFIAKEYWLENYATQSANSDTPNSMWKKRPYAQLAKCTEAQALRRAWPEVGSDPTIEEMEGKVIERDITPQKAEIQRSKLNQVLESVSEEQQAALPNKAEDLQNFIEDAWDLDGLSKAGQEVANAYKSQQITQEDRKVLGAAFIAKQKELSPAKEAIDTETGEVVNQ